MNRLKTVTNWNNISVFSDYLQVPYLVTYLEFHFLFTLPLAILLGLLARRKLGLPEAPLLTRLSIPCIVLVAVLYTTPWDASMIAKGVWGYGEGVVSITGWGIPAGEYAFFVIQTCLTGFLLHLLIPRLGKSLGRQGPGNLGEQQARWAGIGICLQLFLFGVLCVTHAPTFYFGSILVWCAPILLLQWAIGGHHLWRVRGLLLVAVMLPTLYLWVLDWMAVRMGLWHFSSELTTGLAFLGLPLEEMLFFLVANVMVVQGILLYHQVVLSWQTGTAFSRNFDNLTNAHVG